ncbi:MAG: hypothetical protein IKN41_04955 [Candidatus Methanomethylophilaceae archaeon]|nr:hypothetical protein [Candidatus Methanomethylophilaceae archaeon]
MCENCIFGSAKVVDIDDDGNEMKEYYCEGREIEECLAVFGCGRFHAKVRNGRYAR